MNANNNEETITILMHQNKFPMITMETYKSIILILKIDPATPKNCMMGQIISKINNIYETYKEKYTDYLSQDQFRQATTESKEFLCRIFNGLHYQKKLIKDSNSYHQGFNNLEQSFYPQKKFQSNKIPGFENKFTNQVTSPFQCIDDVIAFQKKMYEIYKGFIPKLSNTSSSINKPRQYSQSYQHNPYVSMNSTFSRNNQHTENCQYPFQRSSYLEQKSGYNYQQAKPQQSSYNPYLNSTQYNQFQPFIDKNIFKKDRFEEKSQKVYQSTPKFPGFMNRQNMMNINSSFKALHNEDNQWFGQPKKKVHLCQPLLAQKAKEKINFSQDKPKFVFEKEQKQPIIIQEEKQPLSVSINQKKSLISEQREQKQKFEPLIDQSYFNEKFVSCLCKGKYNSQQNSLQCQDCHDIFHKQCLKINTQESFSNNFFCCWCQLRSLDCLDQTQIVLQQSIENNLISKPVSTQINLSSLGPYMQNMQKLGNYFIVVRCSALNSYKIQNQFPDNCSVWINERKVAQFKNQPVQNGKRNDQPIRISLKEIKQSGWNQINLKIKVCQQDAKSKPNTYIIGIYLVFGYTQSQYIQKFKSEPIEVDDFLQKILLNSADGIEIEQVKFNLQDPYSKLILNIPVRGDSCKHPQCFDLANFIYLSSNSRRCKCPICGLVCRHFILDTKIKSMAEEFAKKQKLPQVHYFKNGNIQYKLDGLDYNENKQISQVQTDNATLFMKQSSIRSQKDYDSKDKN